MKRNATAVFRVLTFSMPMTKTSTMTLSICVPLTALSLPLVIKTESNGGERFKAEARSKKHGETCAAKLSCFCKQTWNLFPPNGLDKAKAECLCDANINCGGHQTSLGFDVCADGAFEDCVVGTRSLGLRCENKHSVKHWGSDMCLFSRKHINFLNAAHSSTKMKFPELRKLTKDHMRANLVAGARTNAHADTMRGATPNFFMVEKPANDDKISFCLLVRMFPNFKTSIVLLDGELFIPHKQKRSHLMLTGLKNDNPHCFVHPTKHMEKLEPCGDLKGFIVVGTKGKKMQVVSDEHVVHPTTETMDSIGYGTAIELATQHPATKPFQMNKCCDKPDVWHTFAGWKHSHMMAPNCDHRLRRIHVFHRPAREETSATRTRTKQKTGEPANCTFMAGAAGDKH